MLKLVREERIARQKVVGKYLYCASDPAVRRRQMAALLSITRKCGFLNWRRGWA